MDKLYKLNEKEIDNLHSLLVDNYSEDNLYKYVFSYEKTRKEVLDLYFSKYINLMKSVCHFYADKENAESYIVIYDSRLDSKRRTLKKFIKLKLGLYRLLPKVKSYTEAKKTASRLHFLSWQWTTDFVLEDYLHITLMFTLKDFRDQGHTRNYMDTIIKYANDNNLDITLETHNENNVEFFYKYGFLLVKTIRHEGITQYCMLKRANNEY